MNQRPRPGYLIVNTLLLWAGLALCAWALWPIYRSPALILMVAVAGVVGALIGVAGAVFRWPAPIVLAVAFVGFLFLGVPLAVPGEATNGFVPTGTGVVDLLTGIALGWKQLLTITLPVGQYEALLVPFYALIFFVAVVASTVAVRARRGGDIAVLGPVVVFIAAIAFGSTTSSLPVGVAIGLLATSLLWIVARRWYRRRAAIRLVATQVQTGAVALVESRGDTWRAAARTIIVAVVVLALASGTGVAAASAFAPQSSRQVLRTTVVQPFQPRNYTSPLQGFRNYWQPTNVNSVMLTARGLPANSRIRIATLDTYDGVVYSVGSSDQSTASGSFTRVPFEFDQSGVSGTPASISITVQNYRGVWLPTVGDFAKVSFSGPSAAALRNGFFYNDTTGTAAVVDRVAAGDSYTLDAVLPAQPRASQLGGLTPGTASVPPIGTVPTDLSSVLGSYVGGAATPGHKLTAMIAALKRNGYISHGVGAKEPVSRSGHGVDRINELLTAQQMIGDGEQYAVTAALMAREIGFPSRVVLGFVPESTGLGTTEIRGKDIAAWIEVNTAQYGWVTIDPNPPLRPIPAVKPKDPKQVSRPQTIVPPPVTQENPPNPQAAPDTQQPATAPLNPLLVILLVAAQVLGVALLVVAVILSPFVAIVALKVRRRRRRNANPTTLGRITGAWDEFEDRVLDHGYTPPAAATRSEVAGAVGGRRTAVLAAVADRAVFSPDEPPHDEAERVWNSVRELAVSLDEGKSRWERIKAKISLRSLARGTRRGR